MNSRRRLQSRLMTTLIALLSIVFFSSHAWAEPPVGTTIITGEKFGAMWYEQELSGVPMWWFRGALERYDLTGEAGA